MISKFIILLHLVLLNSCFFNLIKKKYNFKTKFYQFSQNKNIIKIIINNVPKNYFLDNDNILVSYNKLNNGLMKNQNNNGINSNNIENNLSNSQKSNIRENINRYENINIKILIKIFHFQEMVLKWQTYYSSIKKIKLYVITKDFIKKYKQKYNYNSLYNYLKNNNEIVNNINNDTNLTDEYINKLINIMIRNNIIFYNNQISLELLDDFKIWEKVNEFTLKKLKYITDFEFVSKEIIQLLKQNNMDINKKYLEGQIIIRNKKTIVIFQDKTNEKFYINNENSFNVEYIIDFNIYNNILFQNFNQTQLDKYIESIYNIIYKIFFHIYNKYQNKS